MTYEGTVPTIVRFPRKSQILRTTCGTTSVTEVSLERRYYISNIVNGTQQYKMAEAPLIRPPPTSGRVRSQKFIGTLFPFDDGNPLFCNWRPLNEAAFRCAIWSHEIAPSTGRHHIQFYGETSSPCSYAQLAQHCGLGPNQCHWEQAQHPDKAWNYCSEEKPEQESRHGCASQSIGERPRGQRAERGRGTLSRRNNNSHTTGRDLAPLFDKLGKRPLRELVDEFPEQFLKYPSGVRWIHQLKSAPQNTPDEHFKQEVYVIYGDGGAGKDRLVRQICQGTTHDRALPSLRLLHHVLNAIIERNLRLWVQPISAGGAWNDGFDDHDAAEFPGKQNPTTVVIPSGKRGTRVETLPPFRLHLLRLLWRIDFDGDMPFRQLFRFIEGYPVQVPVKGGFTTFRPKVVIFTSDRHPNGWLFIKDTVSRARGLLSPDEQVQLYRRITRIYHLRGPPRAPYPLGGELEFGMPPTEEIKAIDFFNNLSAD